MFLVRLNIIEKNKKKVISRFRVPLIITCPICGFTFRYLDPITRKKNTVCPICNYSLMEYSKPKIIDL